MATEYTGTVTFNFKFRDRDLNTSTTGISFALGAITTLAEMVLIGDQVGALLAAVSDATYMGVTISINTRENPVVTALAVEASDVERKGMLTFSTAGGTTASVKIPSILATLVIDRGQQLDVAAASLAAVVTALLNGPVGGGNGAATAAGVQYEALYSSKKIHLGSSKG